MISTTHPARQILILASPVQLVQLVQLVHLVQLAPPGLSNLNYSRKWRVGCNTQKIGCVTPVEAPKTVRQIFLIVPGSRVGPRDVE